MSHRPRSLARPALAALALAATLGGCAAAPAPRTSPPAAPGPAPAVPRPTQDNRLIGHEAGAVTRLFGTPRLDVTDGAGRKLQFSGGACILDVYFYAPQRGADPVAAHVDARTPDGRNAEPTSCIEALRR